MNKLHKLVLAMVVCSFSLVSAADWLHGTVLDTVGKPLCGALIWFSVSESTTVTDSAGKYAFTADPTLPVSFFRQQTTNRTQPVFTRNSISFTVTGQSAPVRLEIVDLSGKCIKRVVNEQLSPQNYSFLLPVCGLPASTYIVSLQIGKTGYSRRVLVQENSILQSGRRSTSALPLNDNRMAKRTSSIIDTVHCTLEKYVRDSVRVITSYEGEVNFVIPSIAPKAPQAQMLGGDTVQYAVQNKTGGWDRYWDTDTMAKQIVYDTTPYYLNPPTQTMIPEDTSSIVCIPYKISAWDGSTDTTMNRLLILYDSAKTDDAVPPVITITPDDTVKLTKGDLFNLKTGVTITDAVDSHIVFIDIVKITDNIRTTAMRIGDFEINFDVPGIYTVNYEVVDTHMNRAKKSRTIKVTK